MRQRLRDDVMFFRSEKSKQKSQVRPKLTKKSWVFNLEFFVELAESRNKLWLKKKEKKLGWPNVQDVELSGTCQVIISNFNFVKLRRFFRYCSRSCQRTDFNKHKKICETIKAVTDDLVKYLPKHPELNSKIGDFWNLTQPKNPLPKEFLRRKMELSSNIWSFADKHECYEATELVLNHCLEILRFDVQDHLGVKIWIVWMFLHLGK